VGGCVTLTGLNATDRGNECSLRSIFGGGYSKGREGGREGGGVAVGAGDAGIDEKAQY